MGFSKARSGWTRWEEGRNRKQDEEALPPEEWFGKAAGWYWAAIEREKK
jgi:hypothetical protein